MEHNVYTKRDFARRTLNRLTKKGVTLTNSNFIFATAETIYTVDNNGKREVLKYEEVLKLAGK